jgi:hypothetical protein
MQVPQQLLAMGCSKIVKSFFQLFHQLTAAGNVAHSQKIAEEAQVLLRTSQQMINGAVPDVQFPARLQQRQDDFLVPRFMHRKRFSLQKQKRHGPLGLTNPRAKVPRAATEPPVRNCSLSAPRRLTRRL